MKTIAKLVPLAVILATTIFNAAFAAEVREDWTDTKRSRTVPIRYVVPEGAKAPYPVVVFSHGLGGSREAAPYLGEGLSSHGYFVIFVQHPGSDTSVWRDKVGQGRAAMLSGARGAANGSQLISRVGDIHFVLDELTKRNQTVPNLKGKLDLSKIAMTGHSFGAGTSMAITGLQMGPMGYHGTDDRVKCAIYFSAPVSAFAKSNPHSYDGITVPGMLMTGTEDNSPINDTKAADRRVPFDSMKAKNQYLVIFNGGDHAIFGGSRGARQKDAFYHERIVKLSNAFLDAYLRGDKTQLAWLKTDAQKYLGDSATLEQK